MEQIIIAEQTVHLDGHTYAVELDEATGSAHVTIHGIKLTTPLLKDGTFSAHPDDWYENSEGRRP